jgi:hypothetical protein
MLLPFQKLLPDRWSQVEERERLMSLVKLQAKELDVSGTGHMHSFIIEL